MFVCLEGIDGAGKSTQARMLVQKLNAMGTPAELVADPGTTRIGTAIRQILLHNDAPISNAAQMLLFSAARTELAEHIKQRLAANVVVICDRWLLSTLVYQGEINQIDHDFILSVFRQTSNLSPDLCVVLDLPPEESAKRTGQGRDRYERVDHKTRSRMRDAYLRFSGFSRKQVDIPEITKNCLHIVNATLPSERIHSSIFNAYTRTAERCGKDGSIITVERTYDDDGCCNSHAARNRPSQGFIKSATPGRGQASTVKRTNPDARFY